MMGMVPPGWDFSFSSIRHYRVSIIHLRGYSVTSRQPLFIFGMSSKIMGRVCWSYQSDWERLYLC